MLSKSTTTNKFLEVTAGKKNSGVSVEKLLHLRKCIIIDDEIHQEKKTFSAVDAS